MLCLGFFNCGCKSEVTVLGKTLRNCKLSNNASCVVTVTFFCTVNFLTPSQAYVAYSDSLVKINRMLSDFLTLTCKSHVLYFMNGTYFEK
jgi:hypothetical protein